MRNIYFKWVRSSSNRQISFIGTSQALRSSSQLGIVVERRYNSMHPGSFAYISAVNDINSISVIGNKKFIVSRIGK